FNLGDHLIETTLVKTRPVEHIIDGKRYSIKLHHIASTLSDDAFVLIAIDRNGRIKYKAEIGGSGTTPDKAELLFRDDGMVEIRYRDVWAKGQKIKNDTIVFKPIWRARND
ncbi:MAG: hypothetical protein D6748_14230, partial [Calditrichaeota bacterium]